MNIAATVRSFIPVSYTHLDVYKRQGNLEARKAVTGVFEEGLTVEALIKRSLKALSQ